MGSLLLSPGSWCTQGSVYARQESISQSCVSCGSSMVGLMATSSKRAYAIPKFAAPKAPVPVAVHWWPTCPQGTDWVLSQALWGPWVLVHTRFVWALWASLMGMGFDSKCEFAPPTILLELLLCPWTWGITSRPVQWSAATTPDLGHGVSPLSLSPLSARQPIANMDTTSSLICC